MIIRYANKNDDAKAIAKLIYETDRFIYPYWFKDKNEGIEKIAELIKEKSSLFYFKNCIIAESEGQIVGLILAYKTDGSFDFDYKKYIAISFESEHVIKNYVLDLQNTVKENTVYVFAVRVKEGQLRKGIARKMFEFLFQNIPSNYFVETDVLVENKPALELYLKVGFKIVKEYKGYNGYKKKKPLCYTMKK